VPNNGDITGAQVGAPDAPDWLSNLVGRIPILGSALQWVNNPQNKNTVDSNPIGATGEALVKGVGDTLQNGPASVFSLATTIDPSQLVTKPVMGILHDVGVGQQGDKWDTGLIGDLGNVMGLGGKLATFIALTGLPGQQNGWDYQSQFNQKAWAAAFGDTNPISAGQVLEEGYLKGQGASILTDPQGLQKMKQDLNNSWYGSMASGSLDAMLYAKLDPTKGAAFALKAGRAAKYVSGPQQADALANTLNPMMDVPYKAAAEQADQLRLQANATEDTDQATALRKQADDVMANVQAPTLPSGIGAKASNFFHAATPGLDLNDATVVGQNFAALGRLDNVTNVQQILNDMAPRLGMGGTGPRAGLPVIAEMWADAGNISDIALQRQTRMNIDLAVSGSQSAMQWLAENYPTIAAKGMRASGAPQEFSLLESAMDAYRNAYNVGTPRGSVMGPSGPTAGSGAFDLGGFINGQVSPARVAEIKAAHDALEQIDRFRSTMEQGGPDGAALSFATSGKQGGLGTQIAPRALESLKAALSNKVADEYLYSNGPSGLMVRVLNKMNTSVAPNLYVNLTDPIIGAQQLANHMKSFQGNVDGLTGDMIQQTADTFARLDQQGRAKLVATTHDAMQSLVAAKYGISGSDLEQLLKEQTDAFTNGRATANAKATAAAANGQVFTDLGDLTDTPTFMKTEYLQNHLDTTAPLFDYKMADQSARFFRDSHQPGGPTLGATVRQDANQLATLGLKGLAAYHSAWKVAQLARYGLLFRAQLDTGLRGAMTLGSATMAQEALNGVNNYLNAHGGLGIGSPDTMAISFQARQLANEEGDVMDNLQNESDLSAQQIETRGQQMERAYQLADIFKERQREQGRFTPTTKLYQQKEAEAQALGDRLRGNATTVGNPDLTVRPTKDEARPPVVVGRASDYTAKPLGFNALVAAHDALDPIRQKNIEQLRDAQAANLTPRPLPKTLTSTPVTHSSNGVMFTGAPTMTDLEAATLPHDLRDSDNTMSDMMMGRVDRGLYQQRADMHNGSTNVLPTDIQWPDKYVYAAHDFEGSYTAHRMLSEQLGDVAKTPDALVRSYLSDPQVQQEFRNIAGGGNTSQFLSWLNAVAHGTASLAPTEEFRQLLLSGKPFDIHDVIDLAPDASKRFPIYGPDFLNEMRTRGVINKTIEKAFKVTLDQPDINLARVPYYTPLYHRNIDAMLPDYVQAAQDAGTLVDHGDGTYELSQKDALDLHTRARQAALNDVHRDMYDVSKTLGVTAALRYIAPFAAPWLQAQQSWARLIYDDPSVWGKLMRYSQTPDMFHMTVNSSTGQPVNPWDGTPAAEKSLIIPLHGIGGLRDIGLNMGSLNVIIQGNTPFSPGFGPLVQVPAQAIIADALPHVMHGELYNYFIDHPENPVNQLLFPRPGDVPKSDVKSLMVDMSGMPTWAKQLSDAMIGENGFGNTYTNAFATRYNYGLAQWRQDHGGADPNLQQQAMIKDEADSAARAAALAKFVTSFGIGISGTAHPIGQFYVDKMHALVAISAQLHTMGTTPEQVFAQNYPAAANLNWSFSQNNGNLTADVNATSDYLKYRSLMDDHRDVMWWIAGPQNLVNAADPSGQFSGGAYNTQLNQGLRQKYSVDDLMKQDQIAMGAGRWNSFKQAMRLYMTQNGIPSLHDPTAGDLAGLQQRTLEQLRQQFPEWGRYMDQTNLAGARDTSINEIKDVIQNPPSPDFLNRPDVKMTTQYLMARDAVIKEAQDNGISNWVTSNSMEPERAALFAYGTQLAASDIVFHQAWTRLFEGEFYKDLAAAKQASQTPQLTSTVLGQTPVGGQ
jgi:hypothetical protein